MKKTRHELILSYIKNNNVSRQDDIIKMLSDNGYNVTQATISRDIKELSSEYEIESIKLVDEFPNTYHVETIAFLTHQ